MSKAFLNKILKCFVSYMQQFQSFDGRLHSLGDKTENNVLPKVSPGFHFFKHQAYTYYVQVTCYQSTEYFEGNNFFYLILCILGNQWRNLSEKRRFCLMQL